MSIMRVGSTEKYAEGWSVAFGKKSKGKTAKPPAKTASRAAAAKKSTAKANVTTKKSTKKKAKS